MSVLILNNPVKSLSNVKQLINQVIDQVIFMLALHGTIWLLTEAERDEKSCPKVYMRFLYLSVAT